MNLKEFREIFDYLIKDKQLLLPLVDGKKHQFYCTFITDKFNQSDLFDLTYEELVEKLKTFNKSKVTIVGKDVNLIKQQIQNDIRRNEFY